CPRGDVGLSGMNTTPTFIGIAVHNGDPMTVAAYDAGASTYFPGFSGFPNGAVDRVIGGDPSTFNTMHSQRVSAIVPCAVNNITAVYNQATGMIEVSADADFVGNVTGEYRLSCVIVEDGIATTGAGWSQVNYYDGGGQGTLTDPTTGFEWSTAGDPVVSTAFGGYKHVAISLSNNDILGDAGSIVTNPTIGTYNHTFTGVAGSIANDQTFANVHAVVMIVNAATAEIVNAGESSISVVTSTEKIADAKFALTVFPNPTVDNAVVSFNLETANNVKMEVYNAMGALVSTKNAGELAVGNHTMAFDGTDLNAGFYFVNLTIGNNVITKKVTLSK
ncbi:MAG: T9SS type A sorting domain-containing protein, partial [Vicingaceae bacterium]